MDKFCDSLTRFSRRPTDEVRIGAVGVGGDNPIRLQCDDQHGYERHGGFRPPRSNALRRPEAKSSG